MRNLDEIKKVIQQHKPELASEYQVKEIGIFGSYARGEQQPESDLDILVEFSVPVGFKFIHLADFLEQILGLKIDITTPDAIKPNRRKYIEQDLIYV